MCFFFQAEDGIRDLYVTGVQTCALPICYEQLVASKLSTRMEIADAVLPDLFRAAEGSSDPIVKEAARSEEHTSELQSRRDLVCRLLLEKKKKKNKEKLIYKDKCMSQHMS